MKTSLLPICILVLLPAICFCQNIGIGTTSPNSSAALDISNTAKGLLIPRMTSTGITAIANPAKGLMVYDSVKNQLLVNMGTAQIPNWQNIVANSGWGLAGNSGTDTTHNFIGTTDPVPLVFRMGNQKAGVIGYQDGNTSFGLHTLNLNRTGADNTAFGAEALPENTTGNYNVAVGSIALNSNTSGYMNVANGHAALFSNTTGNENIAIGVSSLSNNTTGINNTATGTSALFNNSTGTDNTANGRRALTENHTGNYNTAVGSASLYNTVSSYNTAIGYFSLFSDNNGFSNTAVGAKALEGTTTGSGNTALGENSLAYNQTGYYNVAVGQNALDKTTTSFYNTVIGWGSASNYDLGYNNTILGANCDGSFDGQYNIIAIGQAVTCTDNNQARIGNSATTSIGGYANWTNISDGRYKKNLKENVQGLAFIMKLRPVTYNLDITGLSKKLNECRGKEMDTQMKAAIAEKEQAVQTGFVAQEVEQAAKETNYAFSGVDKPKTDAGLYGLRYSEFVVPLVKAMQEQQQMIEALKKDNQAQSQMNLQLQKQIDELKALIKK